MLSHLAHLLGATSPGAVVVLAMHALALLGAVWLSAQVVGLWRQWRLLSRTRALFQSAPLRDVAPSDFPAAWSAAGGAALPAGWVTTRIRDLLAIAGSHKGSVDALRFLARQRTEQRSLGPRCLAGALLLLGLTAAVGSVAASAVSPVGLLFGLGLAVLSGCYTQCQAALLLEFESFSVTMLEPRILTSRDNATPERFAHLLEESSRRFADAIQPFTASLDPFSQRLCGTAEDFSHRLENASHNLLQCVEGMRSAATELCQGTGRLDDTYARIEAMTRNVEAMAAMVATGHEQQEERLRPIAAGLHGVAQSLTTVVASANQTQAAVAGVATDVSLAAKRLQDAAPAPSAALDPATTDGATAGDWEGVTLRRMVEAQQQFINTLDDRLTCLTASPAPKKEAVRSAAETARERTAARAASHQAETLRRDAERKKLSTAERPSQPTGWLRSLGLGQA